MKKIFSPAYRQHYFDGYAIGLNPLLEFDYAKRNEAFRDGFESGRSDYESMNGRITEGIPACIVTKKVLEDFLMAGLLGLSIDTEGYTDYQLRLLQEWYQSGVEKYEPNDSIALFELLEKNGIIMG